MVDMSCSTVVGTFHMPWQGGLGWLLLYGWDSCAAGVLIQRVIRVIREVLIGWHDTASSYRYRRVGFCAYPYLPCETGREV
jgi:hypothetical protein